MNDRTENSRCNRRELFRSLTRYSALGGIALVSARLIARRDGTSASDACRRVLSCDNCSALSGCRLPRALAEKTHPTR